MLWDLYRLVSLMKIPGNHSSVIIQFRKYCISSMRTHFSCINYVFINKIFWYPCQTSNWYMCLSSYSILKFSKSYALSPVFLFKKTCFMYHLTLGRSKNEIVKMFIKEVTSGWPEGKEKYLPRNQGNFIMFSRSLSN